jgi:hypothetical protein
MRRIEFFVYLAILFSPKLTLEPPLVAYLNCRQVVLIALFTTANIIKEVINIMIQTRNYSKTTSSNLKMNFITTEKGKRKLIINGYMYVFQKILADEVSSWECVLRRKGHCNARVKITATDEFIEHTNEHTHPSSEINCELSTITSNLKRRATDTMDTSQQILGAELTNISEGAAVNLPIIDHLRRNIRRTRENRDAPPLPANREAIPDLPNEFRITSNGEPFLIFDSGIGDLNRILIFASPQGLQFLSNSQHWYADGTFKVCPELFFQLYTIHAQQEGKIFPCIFSLLPNKTENTYTRFFTEVLNHTNAPNDILVDFEKSAINAIHNVNPNIETKGCFYHLSANILKHIKTLGMQVRYNTDQEFALHLRMISAIAFLPPNNVIDGFEVLCDAIRNHYGGDVDDLLEYFEDTYIGRFRRNVPRRPPMFNIDLWNMFHRSDDELPRTNNSVEGWHRAFQCHLTCCHPNFWKFISILQREESIIRVSILQHLGGHPPPPQRRRYADCNARILRIVDNFPNHETLDYLRRIAHNIGF